MNENKTPADSPVKVKRKALYTALIAAGALLVAAAIVLTIVFTVPREPGVLDEPEGPTDQPGDDPDDGDDDSDDPGDEPGNAEVIFALPVQGATVGTAYTFWYNSTLNRYNLHTGVDFKAPAGTTVTAAYAGRVESITDTLLEGGRSLSTTATASRANMLRSMSLRICAWAAISSAEMCSAPYLPRRMRWATSTTRANTCTLK